MRGRFIVLEGIDGCGKTTQIEHLVEWLPSSGLMPAGSALICTREPGGTPLGRAVRAASAHLGLRRLRPDSGAAAVCGRPGAACGGP